MPVVRSLLLLAALSVVAVAAPRVPNWVGLRLSVGVYCGATDKADAKYAELARRLGEEIARQDWTLVWGGSRTGLMGAVATGARDAGGRTVGIIPEFIHRWEVADNRATELMVVTTMHERKMLLQVRSDVFVVLPGGIGTLDEIADTLDLRNLDQHRKPIIILNQDGYYDPLLAWIDRSIAEKFTKPEVRNHILIATNLEQVIDQLRQLESAAVAQESTARQ